MRTSRDRLLNVCATFPFLQCSTCPDPPTCARLLEEKWRQAYQAVFRFGWYSHLATGRHADLTTKARANHPLSSDICAHWRLSRLLCRSRI